MSAETTEWLNTYTLQSRAAWHTSDALQKLLDKPTVYDGPIPVADVASRLFGWEAVSGDVTTSYTTLNAEGVETITITDPTRQTIIRPPGALGPDDEGAILGVFKMGYQKHQPKPWLLDNVATLLDGDLDIFSAGLLKGGAQAWVQVSVPDTITTPEGVTFKPNLLAVTSFDGSLATTYKRTVTNTVCDNTMGMALAERTGGGQLKIKHSRNSIGKLLEARDALQLVHSIADDFAAEVAELTATTVTDKEFQKFLDSLAPMTKDDGTAKEGRGLTMAGNKQDELRQLYNYDQRVAPWKGTAYGVVQAVNTHAHHVQTVKGSERDERNQTMAVTGGFDKLDIETMERLATVL